MSKDVIWHGDQVLRKIDGVVAKRMQRMVQRYERIVQEKFREEKSGREYVRRSRIHVASAPGEAPAIDTGRLRQAVTHQITRVGLAAYEGVIGVALAAAKYAKFLEFGTSRMEPRPVWLPSLMQLKTEIRSFFEEEK